MTTAMTDANPFTHQSRYIQKHVTKATSKFFNFLFLSLKWKQSVASTVERLVSTKLLCPTQQHTLSRICWCVSAGVLIPSLCQGHTRRTPISYLSAPHQITSQAAKCKHTGEPHASWGPTAPFLLSSVFWNPKQRAAFPRRWSTGFTFRL